MTVIEQIVQRGDDAIAQIEHQIADNAQRIASVQAELDQLHSARESHLKQIEESRATVERLQDAYNQAMAYAKLVHDTPNEQGAIKAVSSAKKELNAAQKHLSQLESKQPDDGREQELISTLQGVRREQEKLQSDLAHTQAAHKKSHQVLGEQKRDAILQAYQEQTARVDILKQQLVEAQADLYYYHQNALQELDEWPDLQREVRNLQPLDNHMSRVLESTIRYIDTLIADMDYVSGDFPGTPWALWDTLFIPNQQMRGAPGQLKDRKKRLEQILEAYRKYCYGA